MPKGCIVVVENPLVANLVRAVLHKCGYDVIVTSASQAAELFDKPDLDGLLITNAPECFLGLAKRVRLVYLTSGPDPELQSAFEDCRVVRKPFTPEELSEAVGVLLGREPAAANSVSGPRRPVSVPRDSARP